MSRVNKYRALKKEPKAYVHGWNGGDQTRSIWVYGSAVIPIYINTYPTDRMEMVIDVNYDELDYWQPSYSTCEIIPNTVGQYVGVKDKNGKEIYEKDIVRINGKRELFVVMWVCDTARFGLQSKEELLYFEFGISSRIEVIGNVYENALFLFLV